MECVASCSGIGWKDAKYSFTVKAWDTREVVVLGSSGAGKSNLCNTLCKDEYFRSSASIDSVSKAVQKVVLEVAMGRKNFKVSLYDTPGYFDSSRNDAKTQAEVMALLKFGVPYLSKLFIVVEHSRASNGAYETLKYYLGLLNKAAAKGVVCIIITKVKHRGREETCQSYYNRKDFTSLLGEYGLNWQEDVLFVDLDVDLLDSSTGSQKFSAEADKVMDLICQATDIHSTFKLFPSLHETELVVNQDLLSVPGKLEHYMQQLMAKLSAEERARIEREARAAERARTQVRVTRATGCIIS